MKRKCIAVGIILLFVGTCIIPAIAQDIEKSSLATSSGNWLYVGGSGPGNYTKIQDAVDNASDRDTVFVYSGVYYEQVIINKTLNLIGENKYNTIIDGNGSIYIVEVKWRDSTYITKFTFRNSQKATEHHYRGGITCINDADKVLIRNCVFLNNSFGINFVEYGSTGNIVSDCVFMNNDAGIFCGAERTTIMRNTITENNIGIFLKLAFRCNLYENDISNNGVGILLDISNDYTIIEHNTICLNGVGIEFRNGNYYNEINENNISSNDGYGIFFSDEGWMFRNLENKIYKNNICKNKRAGIYAYNMNAEPDEKLLISCNVINDNGEEGIFIYDYQNFTISGNHIQKHEIGIKVEYGQNHQITFNNISDNDIGIKISTNLNIIYHNNFINNGQNAFDEGNNQWDNGYPSGGNFWSDYNGRDNYQGPNQDIQGSDGIGDVPYDVPEGTNQDKYPLMELWNILKNPPDKPNQPSGETNGKIKAEYNYTISTTDPEGDQVYYLWDWGDGNNSGWFGPYNSGVTAGVTHNWTVKGSYSIKVKAKDIFGAESPWSDPLPITMPYSYTPIQQFLDWLFQRFPHAFPLLRYLMEY